MTDPGNYENCVDLNFTFRNCWWKCQDDPGYDLDYYFEVKFFFIKN